MTQAEEGERRSMVAEFSVDVSKIKQVKLLVDPLGSPRADHSIWIDPKLVRRR